VNTDSGLNHTIALEVTVPRIVLPFPPPAQATDDTSAGSVEDAEQLSLLTTQRQQRDRMPQFTRVTDITPEVTTHATTTTAIFRLFRLKITAIPGWLYLLRIRHRQKPQTSEPRTAQKGIRPQYSPLIDDLACSITFSSIIDDSSEQHARRPLTPGRHEVVILLDEEGIPTSYRIDGVEG
jgi:hypothetical protein